MYILDRGALLCLQELRPATWGLSCALVVEFVEVQIRRKFLPPKTIRGGNRGSCFGVCFFWVGWEIS